jgi:cyclophilin family peptidyl-prolyl cis-trans isomerase
MRAPLVLVLALVAWLPEPAGLVRAAAAQAIPAGRLAVLQAEARGGATARDLAAIRAGVGSGDPQTVRIAVRALGRLQKPALIGDFSPPLRHSVPEIRAEAANAIAQAAQGLRGDPKGGGSAAAAAAATLIARLKIEEEPSVRAALCEAIARIPYSRAADVERAEAALLAASANTTITDRLGVAKGFEALVRVNGSLGPTGAPALEYLNDTVLSNSARSDAVSMRDVRVRRLALEALIATGSVPEATIDRAAADPDPQVRRLAMVAVAKSGRSAALAVSGVADPAPMVRIEALRALQERGHGDACDTSARATRDRDLAVSLVAIDLLASCGVLPDAVATLEQMLGEPAAKPTSRVWQRGAHALVALAAAAPDRARAALARFSASPASIARVYAAHAVARLDDRESLETFARDADDRVANVALAALGRPLRGPAAGADRPAAILDATDLRRLAAPRARITIHDVGVIDVALFTAEAPATVLRFAEAAAAGAYKGRAFGRFSPGEFAQLGDVAWPESPASAGAEVGLWPHVRGSLAVLGPTDAAAPDFFFDIVDAPQLDHVYAVFGQVLNGIDLLDQIAEGDLIESIEILP